MGGNELNKNGSILSGVAIEGFPNQESLYHKKRRASNILESRSRESRGMLSNNTWNEKNVHVNSHRIEEYPGKDYI